MNPTFRQFLELAAFPVAMAAGQLLFKRAANQIGTATGTSWVLEVVRQPSMWLALALYGAATLLWVRILTTVPLSRAYPFAALAFVLVPAASYIFFNESLSVRYALGTALIIAGVVVVARA
jgi:multidrug transporter EmrE-like cation transporter